MRVGRRVAALQGIRQASGRFTPTDARVRNSFRLLPLSLCIALALPAQAAEDSQNWGLCPVEDAIPRLTTPRPRPASPDCAPSSPPTSTATNCRAPRPDTLVQGNVQLRRGDQFLGTDKLTYNSETGQYVAEGSVRYQDSGMRIVADARRGQPGNRHPHASPTCSYQLIERRGNGGADKHRAPGRTRRADRLHLFDLRSFAARVGTARPPHRHRHRGRHGRGAQRHPAHRQGAGAVRAVVHVPDRRPPPHRPAVSGDRRVRAQRLRLEAADLPQPGAQLRRDADSAAA